MFLDRFLAHVPMLYVTATWPHVRLEQVLWTVLLWANCSLLRYFFRSDDLGYFLRKALGGLFLALFIGSVVWMSPGLFMCLDVFFLLYHSSNGSLSEIQQIMISIHDCLILMAISLGSFIPLTWPQILLSVGQGLKSVWAHRVLIWQSFPALLFYSEGGRYLLNAFSLCIQEIQWTAAYGTDSLGRLGSAFFHRQAENSFLLGAAFVAIGLYVMDNQSLWALLALVKSSMMPWITLSSKEFIGRAASFLALLSAHVGTWPSPYDDIPEYKGHIYRVRPDEAQSNPVEGQRVYHDNAPPISSQWITAFFRS